MCLNEVKSWHNENLTDDYVVVTETRASKSHGSMILAKKRTTKIEVKAEKFETNDRGKVFEIKKHALKNLFEGSGLCLRPLSLGYSSLQLTRLRFETIRNF